MMRAGSAHKASQVLTAILVTGFVFVSSCTPEEQIVYVPMEVPADCPPSAPRGVYAVNLDGYVQICWYPNPEDDIVGYDIWKNDELYGTYEWIGTVDAEVTDPYEYCFEYGDFIATGEPVNGEQFYYAVSAYDLKDNLSELSYEDVSATPRPEGFLRLYDVAIYPDSCGYDFTNLNSKAQDCALLSTDLKFDTIGGVNLFSIAASRVMIQDYGYTYSFDDINLAPEDGWSLAGSAEAIESHCYILRLSESDGFHYVKLWVHTVANGYADFWWAYQTDPYNTDLLMAGGDDDGMNSKLTSGTVESGGIKIMNGFPKGRQVPPTLNSSGKQDDDRILQRQNTLP
jgi:hypothetical protein